MTHRVIPLAIVLLLLIISGSWYVANQLDTPSASSLVTQTSPKTKCVPTFVDGGGPYYLANSPFRDRLAPETTTGETLIVSGRILRNDCTTPITNTILDIWQADETGEYLNEWYRGQVRVTQAGMYQFETVIPKGYGEGTGYRPPHIHFKVWQDGQELVTSQMFFPEIKGTFEDAYIMKVEKKEEQGRPVWHGYHDIVVP